MHTRWIRRCALMALVASGCAAPEGVGDDQSDVSSDLTSTATDLNIARGGSIDVTLLQERFFGDERYHFGAFVQADIHSRRRTDCQVEILSADCKLIACAGPYYGGDLPTDVDTGQIRATATSVPGGLNSTPDPRTHQYTAFTTESSYDNYNAPATPLVGPGDRVRVVSGGGAIPAVGLSVVVPSAIVVQPNRLFLAKAADGVWPRAEVLDRNQDLVTAWTGGTIGYVQFTLLRHYHQGDLTTHRAVSLECVVPAARGEIAVPSSWLQRIPAGASDGSSATAGWTTAWVKPVNRATAVAPSAEGWSVVDVNVESFAAEASAVNQTSDFTIQ